MDDQRTDRAGDSGLKMPRLRISLRSFLLIMAFCCVMAACLRAYLDGRQYRINELSERLIYLEDRQELLIGMMNSYQYHEGHTLQRTGELKKIMAEVVEIKKALGKKITAPNLKADLPARYLGSPHPSNR
jgi:hypothetical protein